MMNLSAGKKQSIKDFRKTCGSNFRDFLLESSLHGIKYIGDATLTYVERIFFFFAFILVFLLSAYFISNIWEKWSVSPVVITMSATQSSITDIPFPAITICNMNQAKKSSTEHIKNDTLDYVLLESLCSNNDHFQEKATNQTGKWSYFKNFLLNVTQTCKDLIIYCRYGSIEYPCINLFNQVLTDEGLCCSFNSIHPRFMVQEMHYDNYDIDEEYRMQPGLRAVDWNLETGYPPAATLSYIPRRARGAGSHIGLSVILNANITDYHCSSTNSYGFKVLLHNPAETPNIRNYGLLVAPGMEWDGVITPRLNSASNMVRKIQPHIRQCLFNSEGNLTYFRTYSKRNCLMECEARMVLSSCGCIMYYMPRVEADSIICSRKDSECYNIAKSNLEQSHNITNDCLCLPSCYELSYTADVTRSPIGNHQRFIVQDDFLTNYSFSYIRDNIAMVHIFYSDSGFRAQSKEELIGFTEFLSNSGGLLGLFMGFSVISVAEIIFYMTMRPYFAMRQLRREELLARKAKKMGILNGKNRDLKVAAIEDNQGNVIKVTPPPQYDGTKSFGNRESFRFRSNKLQPWTHQRNQLQYFGQVNGIPPTYPYVE